MFSDTHCHLSHIQERGENLAALLSEMTESGFPFVLDIGTKPGDFDRRLSRIRETGAIPAFLHFSCGLWPDARVIADRNDALTSLGKDIGKMLDLCRERALDTKTAQYAALGECGLDRYWNGPQALERPTETAGDDGPGTADLRGEEELFSAQLDVARQNTLAVVVHSREAFDATIGCIKNSGWDRGVIHCYSYGIEEARAFLDRGWYISFPGNITYGKKDADRERIARLLRYIPRTRLLLETDAPYMAPVPHRGKTNTPLLIGHIYAPLFSVWQPKTLPVLSSGIRRSFLQPPNKKGSPCGLPFFMKGTITEARC
jgi:TatD DNase family protein